MRNILDTKHWIISYNADTEDIIISRFHRNHYQEEIKITLDNFYSIADFIEQKNREEK